MKKYFLYIITLLISLSACKEMDTNYKEFIVPNGHIYPQKADSLKIYPGENRLRLKWLKPKSPRILHSWVYWNNYTDSLKVEYNPDIDTISIDILDLAETTYTFYIKNFDVDGNVSIPAEGSGTPYGDNYFISANDRTYASATRNAEFVGTINWGPRTSDLVYTEIKYVHNNGEIITLRSYATDRELVIPEVKQGETFEYRSIFLPRNGIDTIYRNWKTSDMPFMVKFARDTWTAVAKGGNHDWGDGGGGQPSLLFDGNRATGWHSHVSTALPQCVVVDMKSPHVLDNLLIYPPAPTNWRYLKDVEIYVSDEPMDPNASGIPLASWGTPAAKVQYTGGESLKIAFPTPQTGRYVAILFKNTSTTNPYVSFMEFEAYGF
ncbi:DUF4998 domain-containing protein [Sphingobacterium sp. HJSM2_6]|uniref:DUF4998 domain-containing protein n=1 Tax=Sphingobacterium sp. HJSM2_6 TaxID=3366264 RepID=UPI003BEC4214